MTELFPSPPVDEHSRHLIQKHGLVLPDDCEAGVYKLRDSEHYVRGQPTASYLLSVDEAPAKHWYFGIPVLEVTLTSHNGPHMLVGRMDVSEVLWSVAPGYQGDDAGFLRNARFAMSTLVSYRQHPKIYHQGTTVSSGLDRIREKTRGWQNWARHLARKVEKKRPDWDRYLEWKADRVRAAMAAEEAAEKAAIDEDVEAGYFDGL